MKQINFHKGRGPGRKLRPRDEDGWIIPSPDTRSRKCYDLMRAGWKTGEIAELLGIQARNAAIMVNRIRNPETLAERHRNDRLKLKLRAQA